MVFPGIRQSHHVLILSDLVYFQVSQYNSLLFAKGSSKVQIGSSEATNIHVFTVLCWEAGQGLNHVSIFIEFLRFTHFLHANNPCCPQRKELLLQIQTLIKTIVLFSSRPVTIHIVNNDEKIFGDIAASFMFNHVATTDTRSFEQVAISFLPVNKKWQPFR